MQRFQPDAIRAYPESVPRQSETYLKSAPQNEHYFIPGGTQSQQYPPKYVESRERGRQDIAPNRVWMKWYILLAISLLIAVVSGLIGGLIGKKIKESRATSTTTSCPSSVAPSSTSTPGPVSRGAVIANVTMPDTGCGWPSRERRRLENVTLHEPKTAYTTLCNSGWPGRGIVGVWTLSPSECVESCNKYNTYAKEQKRPSTERVCVGAGFIPDWTNQAVTQRESNGEVFNCHLQSDVSDITPNDRAAANVEIVALCLPGRCDDIML